MLPLGMSRCVHISKVSKFAFLKSKTHREFVRCEKVIACFQVS